MPKRPAPAIYAGQVWSPAPRSRSRVRAREVLAVFADEFGMTVEYSTSAPDESMPVERWCTRASFENWITANRATAVEQTEVSSKLPIAEPFT